MKKVLRVLLALALPFSANAANICMQNEAGVILKFKRPAVAKLGAAAISGKIITPAVPATEGVAALPPRLGYLSGNVVAKADGKLDYFLDFGFFPLEGYQDYYYFEVLFGDHWPRRYGIVNADRKTYIGSAFSYDDGDPVSVVLTTIDCKTVPVF